jgi:hypothetical protein
MSANCADFINQSKNIRNALGSPCFFRSFAIRPRSTPSEPVAKYGSHRVSACCLRLPETQGFRSDGTDPQGSRRRSGESSHLSPEKPALIKLFHWTSLTWKEPQPHAVLGMADHCATGITCVNICFYSLPEKSVAQPIPVAFNILVVKKSMWSRVSDCTHERRSSYSAMLRFVTFWDRSEQIVGFNEYVVLCCIPPGAYYELTERRRESQHSPRG